MVVTGTEGQTPVDECAMVCHCLFVDFFQVRVGWRLIPSLGLTPFNHTSSSPCGFVTSAANFSALTTPVRLLQKDGKKEERKEEEEEGGGGDQGAFAVREMVAGGNEGK